MECITFGDDFNQRIQPNILPKSVKSITFGHDFNQEIKQNVLPHSLTHLNTYGNRMINIPYDNKRFLLWCPPLGIDNITHKNNMNKLCKNIHTYSTKRLLCDIFAKITNSYDTMRAVYEFL